MQIELFLSDFYASLDAARNAYLERLKHDAATTPRTEASHRSGFNRVAELEAVITPKLEKATYFWRELTGNNLATWQEFLPTAYRRTDEGNFYAAKGGRPYSFSQLPTEVLAAITFANDLACFDRIEIWTAEGYSEREYHDGLALLPQVRTRRSLTNTRIMTVLSAPMAIGIIVDANREKHYFQIVRWGEILVPFAHVESYVWLQECGLQYYIDQQKSIWLIILVVALIVGLISLSTVTVNLGPIANFLPTL